MGDLEGEVQSSQGNVRTLMQRERGSQSPRRLWMAIFSSSSRRHISPGVTDEEAQEHLCSRQQDSTVEPPPQPVILASEQRLVESGVSRGVQRKLQKGEGECKILLSQTET